jgi:hypothetical protein
VIIEVPARPPLFSHRRTRKIADFTWKHFRALRAYCQLDAESLSFRFIRFQNLTDLMTATSTTHTFNYRFMTTAFIGGPMERSKTLQKQMFTYH